MYEYAAEIFIGAITLAFIASGAFLIASIKQSGRLSQEEREDE